jgi:hypothetical protein
VADGWIKRTFSIRKQDSDQVHIVGYLKLDHARKMLDMPECTPTGQSRIHATSQFRGVVVDFDVLNRKSLKSPHDIIPLQVQDSIPPASSGQAPLLPFYPLLANSLVASHVLPLQMPQHLDQVHHQQQQSFATFVPFAATPYQPNGFTQSSVEGYAPDAEDLPRLQQYSCAPMLQHPHQNQLLSQPQPVAADCMPFGEQPEGQDFAMDRYHLANSHIPNPMLEASPPSVGLPYAPAYTMPSSTEAVYGTGVYAVSTFHSCPQHVQPEPEQGQEQVQGQEQDPMALFPSQAYTQ